MNKDLAYEQLGKFAGRWNTEGRVVATNGAPEIRVFGTDTYEWLPGGFFLLHKVDVLIGDEKNETLEIIGFDEHAEKYTMQHYDNNGNSGFMTATCEEEVWTFIGEGLRFTGGFKNDDEEFSGIWEQSPDGKIWTHFMDIKLNKFV